MNRQELQDGIKKLQEEFDEKINELNEKVEMMEDKPKTVWDLKMGDKCWILNFDGDYLDLTWEKAPSYQSARDIGNVFLTKQEAKNEVRKRELISKAKKSQGGYIPNWRDWEEKKYYIYYDYSDSTFNINWAYGVNNKSELGYWETTKQAEQFTNDNRDELEWYFVECE